MTEHITRRNALAFAGMLGAAGALGRRADAAERTLNVLCHRVHELCLTTGVAGNLTLPWQKREHARIVWTTFDTNPLEDRLFRECSLGRTEFGVGYLVNSRATPNIASLFQDLDGYQKKLPIEDFEDFAPNLVKTMTIEGKLIGVPVRTATMSLFYNEALLEQRGIKAPPASLEELVSQAKELTFRPSGGTPVVGLAMASSLAVFPVAFMRAYGGDFITPDLKLLPDPSVLVKTLTLLHGMFKDGSLPRSFATMSNDDQVTWLQQGRAAFTLLPFARYQQLNDPKETRFPGKLTAIEFPMSEALKGKVAMASPVEFWAMSIPGNSVAKDLGWSFIQAMSSKAITLGAALNGNGPARLSTFTDPRFTKSYPLAHVEAHALATGRVPLPAFPKAAQAQAIFLEEVQLAVLGRKTPEAATDSVLKRVKPLLPA